METIQDEKEKYDLVIETPILRGFIRGMLPLYVLMILKKKPRHGTEVIRAFSEISGHTWKPSPGSIYPVLKSLEHEGLLRGRWKRGQAAPQRVYHLTDRGKAALPELTQTLMNQLRQARNLIDTHLFVLEQTFQLTSENSDV